MGDCELVVARDDREAAWFRAHQDAPVVVGGDLKRAGAPAPNPLRWSRPFVVGASTRSGDEAILLEAVSGLADPPQLLLAPRHPERFAEVADLLDGANVCWVRRTTLNDGAVPVETDVVLLDTVGELAGCLTGAAAAFIGGTFDRTVGGHSPAEAARAGVPVVAGPHRYANSAAFAADTWTAESPAELGAALAHALAEGGTQWSPPAPGTSGDPDRTVPMVPTTRSDTSPVLGRNFERTTASNGAPAAVQGALVTHPQTVSSSDAGAAVRTAAALRPLIGTPAPESCPRPWALPLALTWVAWSTARNLAYRWGVLPVHRLPVPVVSVGSTNSRGPGKTSTVRWIAAELQRRGHVVGIATRGYRRTRGDRAVCLSTETTAAADLGDEGALLAQDGWLVAAGPNRVAAARRLVDEGATVVVLDDGMQHRRLHRDVDIAVVDARFPGGRGILPAGERREWQPVPARVTGRLVHHASPWFTAPADAAARRVPTAWRGGAETVAPSQAPPHHAADHAHRRATGAKMQRAEVTGRAQTDGRLSERSEVAAFAGLGRAADLLDGLGTPVARFRALADHQPVDETLGDALAAWAGDLPLVCTAKDAVRLPEALRRRVWWRDIELHVDDPPEAWFPPAPAAK